MSAVGWGGGGGIVEEASLLKIIFIDLPVYLLSHSMWYSLILPHYNYVWAECYFKLNGLDSEERGLFNDLLWIFSWKP